MPPYDVDEAIASLMERFGYVKAVHAEWEDGICTACNTPAVCLKAPDGHTFTIETPRCPSCGAFMKHFDSDGEEENNGMNQNRAHKKPMSLQEVTERLKGESRFPAWVEQYNNGFFEKAYATREAIRNTNVNRWYNKAMSEDYRIGFRYWDCEEKPTEEERKAAKWDSESDSV